MIMGATSIEWTDRTINPIRARHRQSGAVGHFCQKISTECANCYASNFQKRFHMPDFPSGPFDKPRTIDDRGCVSIDDEIELFFDQSRLDEVLARKKPTKWFWCDMTDVFGAWVPEEWINRCFHVMEHTSQHTHQVLTKRVDRLRDYLNWRWGPREDGAGSRIPAKNIWAGVSVGNQATADKRREAFRDTRSAVKFVSYEPAVGPVDWTGWEFVQQIISGGESGPGARPAHPDWHRATRDFCQAHGIAYFFKQWGEWGGGLFSITSGAETGITRLFHDFNHWVNKASTWVNGGTCIDRAGRILKRGADFARARDEAKFPVAVLHRLGKKAAGRLLDGREWSEFPQPQHQPKERIET